MNDAKGIVTEMRTVSTGSCFLLFFLLPAAAAEYARNQRAKKLEAIQLVVLAFGREFVFVYLWALVSRVVSITASLITLSSLGSFFGISKLLVTSDDSIELFCV